MDEEHPDAAEALISAVNEALAGGGELSSVGPFLAGAYGSCLAAGFPEQRAFEITLTILQHMLTRIAFASVTPE